MIVHRKGIEKRNPKLKNSNSIEYHIHKNRPQRSYQWGTLGNSRKRRSKTKKNSEKNHFHEKLSQGSYQGGTQGR